MEVLNKKILDKAYFRESDFVLFNADCIELLQKLPENSVDLIFADPPYNLSNGGFTVHSGKRVAVNKGDWDKSQGVQNDFDFHVRWLEECRRVLKINGTIWISGTYHSIYQCGYALQLLGYKILNDIAWYKPNAAPNLSCRRFTASHETLIWAAKSDDSKFTFNYDAMKNGDFLDDFIKKPNKQMRSVWSISTPPPREKVLGKHPTQKPLKLLERIIISSTNKSDVVLDPFTGSSTTGIASVELRRKFIGIDLEKDFLDLSIKRYGAIK
ncbi:MAG: site-specific DNA-methyltransferase [Candidatus Nomurabacteria bacterium]|nr:site-specific DNA-methyltransferase [Candidatus Nomurabacteria bacterium]